MKRFERVLALILILGLIPGFACAWELGDEFPLKEEITYTITTSGARLAPLNQIDQSKDWQSLLDATNIKFNFNYLGAFEDPQTRDVLQNRLMSGEYGDAIASVELDTLNKADILELASTGILVPITRYVTDPEVMPNLAALLEAHPEYLPGFKSSDGEIYYLSNIEGLCAYDSGEALLQVNSAWLQAWKEARGRTDTPKDLAEFEDLLMFFRDTDLNGDAQKNEIPYFITQGTLNGAATLEHAMGLYGIATKDSSADMDIMINDEGICRFVYTTDAYKDALKTFSKWYQQGFVWNGIFTGNAETVATLAANAATSFGVINSYDMFAGFETLLPPEIEGYQPRFHMHPSTRTCVGQPQIVFTDKCQDPVPLLKLLDMLFYDYDANTLTYYGTYQLNNGYITYNAETGKYVFDQSKKNLIKELTDVAEMPITNFYYITPPIRDAEIFNDNVDVDAYFNNSYIVDGHILYSELGLWNKTENIWPRCPLLAEDAEDFAFLYTDVSTTVAEYRAKFISGQLDIDENWDAFQAKLTSLGVETMLEIVQRAYDAYMGK